MKKTLWIAIGALFLFGLVGGTYAEAKPVVIRIADHSPSTGIRAEGVNWMTKEVEKATGGAIKFQVYWGGSLLKAKEMIRAVSKGAADIAFSWPGKRPKELPIWQALPTILIGPKDVGKATQLCLTLMKEIPSFEADFARWNLKVLGVHQVSGYNLFMTKPLKTIYDLKGLKVRSPDKPHLAMIKAIGGTPIFMPMSEAYPSMQRGTIDGVFCPLESGHRFKFHEVAKYQYPCLPVWGSVPNVAYINVNTWKKIPADARQKMEEICAGMSMKFADLIQNGYTRFRNDFKKAGCEVRDMPDEDLIKWTQMPELASLPDQWVKKASEQGLPAEMVMSRLKELVAEAMK
jgi:TRAP-type C4-dicarboxylate transport system substrate-binding protein